MPYKRVEPIPLPVALWRMLWIALEITLVQAQIAWLEWRVRLGGRNARLH